MLAAKERAVEIDRHHLAPQRVIGALHRAERRNAGGVDQAVEPTGACTDRTDHPLPVRFRRDIERVIDARPPRR